MGPFLFFAAVVFALVLTAGGADFLVRQVEAADGFKASVIALVLSFGLALLGPSLLCALLVLGPRRQLRASVRRAARCFGIGGNQSN